MKLHQVIALTNTKGKETVGEITKIHRQTQNQGLVSGMVRTYQPRDEDGEQYPSEEQRVGLQISDALASLQRLMTDKIDLSATKDHGNRLAKADVVIDGETILKDVPAITLLSLEKELVDLLTLCRKMCELSGDEQWALDEGTGLMVSRPQKTQKTKREQKVLELSPATKEHPANVQLVPEDRVVGDWTTIKKSGAISPLRKREIVERIVNLRDAVILARKSANEQEVTRSAFGNKIFSYILG